ncbi:hypothetical protein H072_6377 [Dactylellina haptotyla CBS 200.50]|uniref:Uncharacterized protein n=1 Tax=Dactylellina haptotyla (strain CBS 200.50) TaxID=1284197 RepID=S8BKJ7_DACHA|nr:hypothetical protein H072_6377 [Dactylellina haptotyla CBS 200.50]
MAPEVFDALELAGLESFEPLFIANSDALTDREDTKLPAALTEVHMTVKQVTMKPNFARNTLLRNPFLFLRSARTMLKKLTITSYAYQSEDDLTGYFHREISEVDVYEGLQELGIKLLGRNSIHKGAYWLGEIGKRCPNLEVSLQVDNRSSISRYGDPDLFSSLEPPGSILDIASPLIPCFTNLRFVEFSDDHFSKNSFQVLMSGISLVLKNCPSLKILIISSGYSDVQFNDLEEQTRDILGSSTPWAQLEHLSVSLKFHVMEGAIGSLRKLFFHFGISELSTRSLVDDEDDKRAHENLGPSWSEIDSLPWLNRIGITRKRWKMPKLKSLELSMNKEVTGLLNQYFDLDYEKIEEVTLIFDCWNRYLSVPERRYLVSKFSGVRLIILKKPGGMSWVEEIINLGPSLPALGEIYLVLDLYRRRMTLDGQRPENKLISEIQDAYGRKYEIEVLKDHYMSTAGIKILMQSKESRLAYQIDHQSKWLYTRPLQSKSHGIALIAS